MATKVTVGELRAWDDSSGRRGTFFVIGVDGFRVDVLLSDGKRDGVFSSYLETNSHVISTTKFESHDVYGT